MSAASSKPVALLQSLKVTAAQKIIGNNPHAHRRLKLARKLWEQIQLAKSPAEGTNFTMTKFRIVKDPDGRRETAYVLSCSAMWGCLDARLIPKVPAGL